MEVRKRIGYLRPMRLIPRVGYLRPLRLAEGGVSRGGKGEGEAEERGEGGRDQRPS